MNRQHTKLRKGILSALLLLASLIWPGNLYSQEIIQTAEGDTLVTITPKQVHLINAVFLDSEYLSEKSRLQSEEISLLEKRIEKADSVILKYSLYTDELKKEMALRELAKENITKKEKRKIFWLSGVGGVVIGVIATLILAR